MFIMNNINLIENNYYVYLYLDPRKPGSYSYYDLFFEYEPFYVGKGKNNRCYNGLNDNHKSLKKNKINKIISDGYLPIVIKHIESISEIDALNREVDLIHKIGRFDKQSGPLTNHTDGGDGTSGHICSIETRKKISIANTDKPKSDATKKKISIGNTNKIRTKEHKDILINSHTGENNHSIEWTDKLCIPVLQYDLSMNLIKEHQSIKGAAIEINITPIQISRVCAGKKYYKSAGGFVWKYKDKNIQGHITKPNIMSNHTEETKQKMRKPKIWKTEDGKHPSNNKILQSKYPAILQYDMNNNLVGEWSTINLLCKELNYNVGYMIKVLHNNKNYAYNFFWKFK